MVVKRCTYKVGDSMTVAEIKEHGKDRAENLPAGTGGFVVKEVVKTNHKSGGYFIVAESKRKVEGSKVEVTWCITHPKFHRKTVRPFSTGFRYFTNQINANQSVNKPTKKVFLDDEVGEKTTVAGSTKRIVLADFLEE